MKYVIELRKPNNFSKGTGYKGTRRGLTPMVSRKLRALKTGLTEEDEKKFEKELGLAKGTLSNKIDQQTGYPESDWWVRYLLTIPPTGRILDTDIPFDALSVLVCKAHKYITLDRGPSNALFYMHSEEEEAENRVKLADLRSDANALLRECSIIQKREFCMTLEVVRGKNISELKDVRILDFVNLSIQVDPKRFIDWVTDPNKHAKAVIGKAHTLGIIEYVNNRFVYNGTVLGDDISSAAYFLKENQPLNIEIQKKIKDGAKFPDEKPEESKEPDKELNEGPAKELVSTDIGTGNSGTDTLTTDPKKDEGDKPKSTIPAPKANPNLAKA